MSESDYTPGVPVEPFREWRAALDRARAAGRTTPDTDVDELLRRWAAWADDYEAHELDYRMFGKPAPPPLDELLAEYGPGSGAFAPSGSAAEPSSPPPAASDKRKRRKTYTGKEYPGALVEDIVRYVHRDARAPGYGLRIDIEKALAGREYKPEGRATEHVVGLVFKAMVTDPPVPATAVAGAG